MTEMSSGDEIGAEGIEAVWTGALDQAFTSGSIDTVQRSFIQQSTPISFNNETLVIAVPNEFTRQILETKYNSAISAALNTAMARPIKTLFTIDPDMTQIEDLDLVQIPPVDLNPPQKVEVLKTPEQDDESRLNPKYTFDTFVRGTTNRFAAAAAESAAEKIGLTYNPLFIYSQSGLGKTHLLHAIGNYARSLYRGKRIRYVSSEEFTNEFINSIRDGKSASFQKKYREIDVLLVDDIQFLSGKVQTQEEFFHTFNTLHNANKQIVITSDLPPSQLQDFEDRMRTRFALGLSVDIQPPDLETRIAILRKKTLQERLTVPAEVLEYIGSKISSNIRELEGALIRVTAWANLNQQIPDLTMAQMVLRDLIPDESGPEISASVIMEVTANFYGVTIEDMCGEKRDKQFVTARQMAMYLCRDLTELSLPKIGQLFGGRDHTTVMHADRKIKAQINEQRVIYNHMTELTQRIKSYSR